MDMALQFQFATGATSLKLGLQSCNCRMQRSVALRSRPWMFQVRAAGDGDVRVNEVARVERDPLPFQGDVLELTEAVEEADVWEDTEENRLRKRAAWRAAKAAKAAREIEEKLKLTTRKKKYAQGQIAKLDNQMELADGAPEKEQITDEERYMFQKLGLRMRARLLLGRRGVFDGTVENMHLHWKHRELVKIIFKGSLFEAERTAKVLEGESGGVLVGITATSKGYAILFFRGKHYKRPSHLRPRNLLTKRQALERSIELQRKRSLEQRVLKLEKEIGRLHVGLYETADAGSKPEREGSNVLAALKPQTELEDFDDAEFDAFAEDVTDDIEDSVIEKKIQKSRQIVLDPIFKAQPLTIKERLRLRQEALKQSDPLYINVGKSNMITGLAKSIRVYFQKHPFAIVGVKGRAKGTPVEEIIQQIEEATGAVLVSREPNKLIIYRGWPAGECRPDMVPVDEREVEVSAELRAAIMSEEVRNPKDFSYLTREECALVGIEYTGNGSEEDDVTYLLPDDDDDDDDDDVISVDIWNEKEDEDEDEDDAEADRIQELIEAD